VGEHVRAGELEIWTEQVGEGPEVLLIAGLGDTIESWQFQLDGLADRYRVTAFDNRGAGRTALSEGPLAATTMADDAAALLRQEVPDEFNARVDAFWREVEARG
jgi:3-oxoadipate enol-lactonase